MRPLPIGVDLFRELREQGCYYVDKTRLIDTFFAETAKKIKVTLITRPRRFGKTLNMDMVKEFFDIEADSAALFDGLEVMRGPQAKEINTRPVLFFSFKECRGTLPELIASLKSTISNEYQRNKKAFAGLDQFDEAEFKRIFESLVSRDEQFIPISNAIAFLSKVVSNCYHKPVILLIDEYDAPMSAAHTSGCYDELRAFFTTLFSSALKGNPYLEKALMTGIQRVAKENIFSGLNNLRVCTVEDDEYADCFGFTESETQLLMEEYGLTLDGSVKAMYDGYQFGGAQLYNPWSILNYADRRKLIPYWVNTSSNSLLQERLEQASATFQKEFDELILNGELSTMVDLQTGSYEGGGDAALWGLFVNAGYLTFTGASGNPALFRRLRIPNDEVRKEFQALVASHIGLDQYDLEKLFTPLVNRHDPEAFADKYQEIVKTVTSYHDARENAYHMLLLGMSVWLRGRYEITSNRESGIGRSDILLKATRPSDWNIIIEFKQGADLPGLAQAALAQIEEKQYYTGLTGPTLLLGIAHSGKECEVRYHEMDVPKEEIAETPSMRLE